MRFCTLVLLRSLLLIKALTKRNRSPAVEYAPPPGEASVGRIAAFGLGLDDRLRPQTRRRSAAPARAGRPTDAASARTDQADNQLGSGFAASRPSLRFRPG